MKQKIQFVNHQIVSQTDFEIAADSATIWEMLTTTVGLAKWFPQIQADNVPNALIFVTEDQNILMPITLFERNHELAFNWDSGKVLFKITGQKNGCQVRLIETLPERFPEINRDLAGWEIECLWLQQACEGVSVTFQTESIPQREADFAKQLDALGLTKSN